MDTLNELEEQSQDVCYAFSVEPSHDRQTLEKYLTKYPQHSEALLDLSIELAKPDTEGPLPENAELLIKESYERYLSQ